MIFNTMSEMKLFLQYYDVYHHRPVTHSDQELRYHVICKNGCMWRLNARKRQSDVKWRITKVIEPHTCLDNRGRKIISSSLHVTLPIVYWSSLMTITTFRCLLYNSPYLDSLSMMWSTKRLGVLSKLPWLFVGVVGRKRTTRCPASFVQCITITLAWNGL